MPPAGIESGHDNLEVGSQLRYWATRDSRGKAFDSNAGLELPNGAVLSPDTAWIDNTRVAALTREQKRTFARISWSR